MYIYICSQTVQSFAIFAGSADLMGAPCRSSREHLSMYMILALVGLTEHSNVALQWPSWPSQSQRGTMHCIDTSLMGIANLIVLKHKTPCAAVDTSANNPTEVGSGGCVL